MGLLPIFKLAFRYKRSLFLSIAANILHSVFAVISIPLLIPFFQLLFERVSTTDHIRPNKMDITLWVKYYMSSIITDYGQQGALLLVCVSLIIIFFLKNVFRYLALYFMIPMRYGIIYELRNNLYKTLLALPIGFFTNERKGNLISSMTIDVHEIENSILGVLETFFKSPIIILGSVIFMISISAQLTSFVFILVIISGLIIGRTVSRLKQDSFGTQEGVANITNIVEESLGGIRIIKAFRGEKYLFDKFKVENTSLKSLMTRVINRRDLAAPLSEFLGVTVVTILMYFGSLLVFKQEMAPENFFAFVLAFYQIIEPAKSFASAYFNVQKGLAAQARVDRILNTTPESQLNNVKIQSVAFNSNIEFKNVSFIYEGDTKVLNNINLTIKKGEVVALVGASGAGKSTIADLLPRFYEPNSGQIFLDGKDTKEIPLPDLRGLFGIVSQEPILFHDTIANNICFGREGVTNESIVHAAKIANAHDFITALPEQYDTSIGERGLKLSGGQRQRITIARAILADPPILILDEATSALDSESERLVQDAIQNVIKDRTTIVIAHRLSTIKNADKIVVLEAGNIVEIGTHEELMALGNVYKNFVEIQNFDL
ncbi:MAG: ABC transporter ATP-binding protein [Saprospiraceae bacterium]